MNQSNKSKKSMIQSSVFVILLGLGGYYAKTNESVTSKAKRASFPGTTTVLLNKSVKNLNLEKMNEEPSLELVGNLKAHDLKILGSVYNDKKNNLMVAITQSEKKIGDEADHFVFAVIRNNQLTQIQKINEFANGHISLQYGKVILDTNPLSAAAETTDIL
jgi:hypothetical protein